MHFLPLHLRQNSKLLGESCFVPFCILNIMSCVQQYYFQKKNRGTKKINSLMWCFWSCVRLPGFLCSQGSLYDFCWVPSSGFSSSPMWKRTTFTHLSPSGWNPNSVTSRRSRKMSLVHSKPLAHNEKATRVLKIEYNFRRDNSALQSVEASSVKNLRAQASWTRAYECSRCSSGIDFMTFQRLVQ